MVDVSGRPSMAISGEVVFRRRRLLRRSGGCCCGRWCRSSSSRSLLANSRVTSCRCCRRWRSCSRIASAHESGHCGRGRGSRRRHVGNGRHVRRARHPARPRGRSSSSRRWHTCCGRGRRRLVRVVLAWLAATRRWRVVPSRIRCARLLCCCRSNSARSRERAANRLNRWRHWSARTAPGRARGRYQALVRNLVFYTRFKQVDFSTKRVRSTFSTRPIVCCLSSEPTICRGSSDLGHHHPRWARFST